MKDNSTGFFKNHADTLAIIGVNLAIAAMLISLWMSQSSRIDCQNSRTDAMNARMDNVYNQILEIIKERK